MAERPKIPREQALLLFILSPFVFVLGLLVALRIAAKLSGGL